MSVPETPDFIVPDSEVPALSKAVKTDASHVPTVDLKAYLAGELSAVEQKSLADEWLKTCKEVGFAYLSGWEEVMPASLIERAFEFGDKFFSLPFEEKDALRYTSESANRGWLAATRSVVNEKSQPGQKETFEIGNDAMPEFPEHWPDEQRLGLEGFRQTFKDLHSNGHVLQQKLMSLIALSLDLPSDYFESSICEKANHLRLLNYPAQNSNSALKNGSRFHAHTDVGTLTCLWQDDVGGLEVKPPGQPWMTVPPVKGTLLINAGDILRLWSNDVISSTLHRTAVPDFSEADSKDGPIPVRRSMAFFGNPNPSAVISCIPGLGEPKYSPFVAKEFYASRLGTPVEV